MSDVMIKLFSRFHSWVLRASGGKLMGRFGGAPVLLLTVQGRKTGRPRTAPLLYLRDGERYIVIASKGGAPEHPDWYLNLVANPEASIDVQGQEIPVTSETLAGPERDRAWRAATRIYPTYDDYAQRTSREIPVVALRPSSAENAGAAPGVANPVERPSRPIP